MKVWGDGVGCLMSFCWTHDKIHRVMEKSRFCNGDM